MVSSSNRVIGGEFAIPHDLIVGRRNTIDIKENEHKYYYSSGRCALFAILKDIEYMFKSGGVLLPNYLCESITQIILDAGYNYSFYHIKSDFHIELDSLKDDASDIRAIILIDYFGMTDLADDINRVRRLYPNMIIITDCVQAYYSVEKYAADYCFTSFRKWFPVPDGAFVVKNLPGAMCKIDLTEGNWWQYKYAGNILKEYQGIVDDCISLKLLEQGEEYLDKDYLCEWNDESKKIFFSLDIEKIQETRKHNAEYLHIKLTELNIKHLYSKEGTPLFIPLLVEHRDELRKAFFKEYIFTPKHWPAISVTLNSENELYDIELSLICDQRYTLEDMEKQISVIKKFRYGVSWP